MSAQMSNVLGIYIPTYNRPTELRLQLNSLLPQMVPGVAIRVNDNASTSYDVETLRQEFPSSALQISVNACNIGGNANIALGFPMMGSYRYVWILGDNDIVSVDAVQIVLKQIEDDPDIVIFGQTKDSFRRGETGEAGWNPHCPGLISQGIYKSSTFLKYAEFGFLFHNSSFPHLAVYYAARRERTLATTYCAAPIFTKTDLVDGHIGEYSLSVAGMPLLAYFFPVSKRKSFLSIWIKDIGRQHFFGRKKSLDFVTDHTRLLLKKYVFGRLVLILLSGWGSGLFRALKASPIWILIKRILKRDVKTNV